MLLAQLFWAAGAGLANLHKFSYVHLATIPVICALLCLTIYGLSQPNPLTSLRLCSFSAILSGKAPTIIPSIFTRYLYCQITPYYLFFLLPGSTATLYTVSIPPPLTAPWACLWASLALSGTVGKLSTPLF